MDLIEFAKNKEIEKSRRNGSNAQEIVNRVQSREFLEYMEPSTSSYKQSKGQIDSHQNPRRQYFDEEGKHASQSLGAGNSASSIRSNNTKPNDLSIVSINQLHPNMMMPDQVRRLLKRTESQGVSDEGIEKVSSCQMTGQFEQKGLELFKDFSTDQSAFLDTKEPDTNELVVSPVARNLEALEMMNDYNSNQIMLLVNQMKSASATKNGNAATEHSVNSTTYDEDTINAILKNNMQVAAPSQFLKQEDQQKFKSRVSLQTSSERDALMSRLINSNKNDSMSMAEI